MRNEVQELQQEEEEETIENKSIQDDKTARLAEEGRSRAFRRKGGGWQRQSARTWIKWRGRNES